MKKLFERKRALIIAWIRGVSGGVSVRAAVSVMLLPRVLLLCRFLLLGVVSLCALLSCSKAERSDGALIIATHPWPGNALLQLADGLGYFKHEGVPVKLRVLSSRKDVIDAYLNRRVDGFVSDLADVVRVQMLDPGETEIVLVTARSIQGNKVVASHEIERMSDLKGQVVGVDMSPSTLFALSESLSEVGLSLSDVELRHTLPFEAAPILKDSRAIAYVAYAPISEKLLSDERFHNLSSVSSPFYSAFALRHTKTESSPGLRTRLAIIWDKAYHYVVNNRPRAEAQMAHYSGLDIETFSRVYNDELTVLSASDSQQIMSEAQSLSPLISAICQELAAIYRMQHSCQNDDLLTGLVR